MVVMGMILIGVGVSVFGSVLVTAVGMLLFGLGSATWNVASNVEEPRWRRPWAAASCR